MKRQRKNKFVCFCLAVLFAAGVFQTALTAEAAAKKPEFGTRWELYLTGNPEQDRSYLIFDYLPKRAEITKVTVDKPSVARVFPHTWKNGDRDIGVEVKRTGTVRMKIRVKSGKKSYTLKSTLVVRKHKNVFASLKVGKTEVKKLFNRAEYSNLDRLKGKQRLSVKPVKGWKVEKIICLYGERKKELENKEILNFKKIKGSFQIEIVMQKTGTDLYRYFKLYFNEVKNTEETP